MITFSVKLNRRAVLACAGVLTVLAVTAVFALLLRGDKEDRLALGGQDAVIRGYTAANNTQRRDFFAQFGWELEEEPIAVSEVVIPEEFDENMERYNAIQREQGLDLRRYRGRRAWLHTFRVVNYPQREDVLASLLTIDERVIGGDLTATGEDGFIRGFEAAA